MLFAIMYNERGADLSVIIYLITISLLSLSFVLTVGILYIFHEVHEIPRVTD